MQTLADRIEYVVQYNEDNRAFSGHTDANITIGTVCDVSRERWGGGAVLWGRRKEGRENLWMESIIEESSLYSGFLNTLECGVMCSPQAHRKTTIAYLLQQS